MIIISTFLLIAGLVLILIKKSRLMQLIGVELMLNAANINFVYFDRINKTLDGQIMTAFVMVLSACEVVIGLSIIIQLSKINKAEN